MDVQIGEVNSTVRAVDGDSLLGQQTMNRIVRAVLQALREEQQHEQRVRAERRETPGVSHDQRAEE